MLAFLFCDRPSIDEHGKTRLDGIFDRIVVSGVPAAEPTDFFVYYKAAVDRPCTLSLRVFDPRNEELPGSWSDQIKEAGLFQSVWTLAIASFDQSGTYKLELWKDSSERLVTGNLVVTHAAS